MTLEHYDPNKDWDSIKKWHKVVINYYPNKFPEILRWLYANIDKPERHARWKIVDDTMQFKFRYERDYIMFTLRWS
jgi:hypothetical protein